MFEAPTAVKLLQQLAYVFKTSGFYQKKYGFLPNQEIAIADFTTLPFTTKKELLDDQEKNPPYGSNLCADFSMVRRIHRTSGTTNKPLLIALTENDIRAAVRVGGNCFSRSGLTAADSVFHCLNYCMWSGGITDHQCLEATGATVVPFGVGNTHHLIEMIKLLKPTAIHCTPSYLFVLAETLDKEFGMSPKELGLRIGLFGGESGLQHQAFRDGIEQNWSMKAMNANYGMSEVLSIVGAECERQEGLHYLADDVVLPEIIDLASGASLPIKQGVRGELVLTNLQKESQPLIRYRTGDVVEVLSTNCLCGDPGFRFEVAGRSDDMFVLKGVNIYPNQIARVIADQLNLPVSNHQVLISITDPVDKAIVRIEQEWCSEKERDHYSEVLGAALKKELQASFEIEFVNIGVLPRSEGKTKRLFRIL
jgi:phenylacetate-CoA ligase